MSREGKFVVVVAFIWCVVCTAFAARRTTGLQLLSLPLSFFFLVAGIVSIVCVFSQWRRRRWRAGLPLAACILAVIVVGTLSQLIRQALFVWALPSYDAVIRQMEAGSIPVSAELKRIPQAEGKSRLAYAVFACRDTNGVLTVEFLTESGFPVKHSGYLYCSDGNIERGALAGSRWPKRRELRSRWYYTSD